MGEAKRRGSFEQRKASRIAKQFGLTKAQINEAYRMNRRYDLNKIRKARSKEFTFLSALLNSLR